MLNQTQQEMITASVQNAVERMPAAKFAPGIVMAVDPSNTIAEVRADGTDSGQFGADILAPNRFVPGDRVMLLFVPPHGVFVIGRRQGDWDDWHVVGTEGEPAFNGGLWDHESTTSGLGTDAGAFVSFTRRSDRVELRGRAERVSGSDDVIYFLPDGYRPANDLLVPASGNLGAYSPLRIDRSSGAVEVIAGTNVSIHDGISFIAATPVDIS